jgi:hypothetical protein
MDYAAGEKLELLALAALAEEVRLRLVCGDRGDVATRLGLARLAVPGQVDDMCHQCITSKQFD